MRRWIAMALVGSGLLVIMTAVPAGALAPEKKHVDDSFEFTNHFCSFPIRVTTEITGSETLFFDQRGNVLRDELHLFVSAIWRNPSSGKQVLENDHVHNVFYADDGFAIMGLNFRLSLPSGRTVLIDAGRLVFDEDGNVLFEAGKHQAQDGDVAALCAALS